MRPTLTILTTLAPTLAAAHPGHLAELAGHSHWVAGAAIAVAAALGLLAWGKRGKAEKEEEVKGEAEGDTPEGAPA